VYIADINNQRIRKVTVSTGIITTVAGSSTSGSFSGDGGSAISATLNYPSGVSVDSAGTLTNDLVDLFTSFLHLGNVYIADHANHRIRKVTISTGIITTIAGTGTGGYSGDNGQATSAALYYPLGIGLDTAGTTSWYS
jgi:hypothetical protein